MSRIYLLAMLTLLASCEKWLELQPFDQTGADNAYSDAQTATAVALSIYNVYSVNFPLDELGTPYASYYADDLTPYQANATVMVYANSALPSSDNRLSNLWRGVYTAIYQCNSLLEHLEVSHLPDTLKRRLSGEARFLRAFGHLHLGGLFGGIPLVTTTDVRKTAVATRDGLEVVYQQVTDDLVKAMELLPAYVGGTEKVRVTREAAAALLARVYLYSGQWQKAEDAASIAIDGGKYLPLPSPAFAFLRTSPETILSFWKQNGFTSLATTLVPSSGIPTHQIAVSLAGSFDTADLRYKNWIGRQVVGADTFQYCSKYKRRSSSSSAEPEYTVVLRLGEQLLIRAEARARQQKIMPAIEDLNVLRQRAGIASLTEGIDGAALFDTIRAERRRELFVEWNHRLVDLRRSGLMDEVLGVKPTWKSWARWYPIPAGEITNNPLLLQNDGYE